MTIPHIYFFIPYLDNDRKSKAPLSSSFCLFLFRYVMLYTIKFSYIRNISRFMFGLFLFRFNTIDDIFERYIHINWKHCQFK